MIEVIGTPVKYRAGSSRASDFRLALTDNGLVLQGCFEWTEYGPEPGDVCGGTEWQTIETVDLRTAVSSIDTSLGASVGKHGV